LAGIGVVAHAVRKPLRTAIAIISLRIAVTSFREANAPAPLFGVTLVYDRGPNVWGRGQGGIGRCVRTSRTRRGDACLATVNPRLAPNSSSLLTQPPRRRSAGPGNTFGAGAADETLRMAWGILHVSRARVPSSSGVGSPSGPNRPVLGTLLRRDCPRFRREAPRIPLRTATLRH
jgi:hypothetical protein